MAEQQELRIRPAVPGDSPALLALSGRLAIGVAAWRDPVKVAAAVRGWVESSLAEAGRDGHAVLVAESGDRIAGLVSLAERAHFSPRTLARRFVEETGYTPMQWIMRARIDMARELLEQMLTPTI